MQDPEFRELPTPQPMDPGMLEEEPSFLERLLHHWKVVAALVAVGIVIAAVSGVFLWSSAGPDTTEPAFERPPSLQELTQQYPELADLLNDPTLGSVYKDFLVAFETGGIEAARDLAAQRGLLNERDEIRITLLVDDAQVVPALSEELQGAGITVEGSYKERINVGVPLALIQQLAEQQGTDALFEQLTQMEHIIRMELPAPKRGDVVLADGVKGEGVSVTGADEWHAAGYGGQSIRVGVLDLGFDGYRSLLGSDLPENVVVASFVYGKEPDSSGEVHGTACAEIVHEMAPNAELFFAYYDSTLVSMGQAVEWLLSQNVHIISNSTSGVVGPMDGSDESAEMVDDAVSRGVLWVNSSGNAAQEHYRGRFADTDGDGLHEFPDGTERMGLYLYAPEVLIALNWDDWERVTEDYDLFLYDNLGDFLASSEDIQSGLDGQAPTELLVGNDVPEGTYFISIAARSTTRAGMLDLYTLGAAPEFPVPDHSLGSPADARGALTVGATQLYDDSLASYSSRGPANDGRLKPELSAPAGVSSSSYAPQVFDGTSASTPHVAGAAALVWSAFPDYGAEQVRDYLQTHALDLGSPGPDDSFGYGRLRLPSPPAQPTEPPPTPTTLPTVTVLPTETPEPTIPPVPTEELAPTLPPDPTQAPGPTAVARLSEPVEETADTGTSAGVSLYLVGALGICGVLVALGGGGLLLVASWRSPRRVSRASLAQQPPATDPGHMASGLSASETWAPRSSGGELGNAMLVGAGRTPAPLGPGLTTLGRSADNDVVIDSLLVSRRHARVECSGRRCTVEDLGSANGLFVNGKRVSRTVLNPGDRLRLGDVELTYQPAGASQARAWLEVGTTRYPLSLQSTSIGRSRDNNIRLADERASRHHARIDLQQSIFVLADLDSANGTFVNGQRIQRHTLRNGDEIRIGDTRISFGQEMRQPSSV
jgi:pSer/pThr/pTyr-binding forkhead associated (FHA) protein/subtilisin family serine protease